MERRSGLLRVPFAVAMLAAVALLVGPAASSAPHPGPLDHFRLASIGGQIAGAGFTVTATAEDASNIPLGSRYTGTPTLSGTLHGSAHGCPDASTACTESYANPPSVSNGVATWTGVTGYKAETDRTVTATDSGKTGTSNLFAVGPNVPDKLTFEEQPTDTQPTVSIAPAVQVLNEDHFGNPEVGVNVTMSLTPDTNGSDGTLSPALGLTQAGDSQGVSTFADLSIDKIQSDHKLRASSGAVNQDSAFFNIANKVSPCAGSCVVKASDQFADITVTVTAAAAALRRTSSAAATGNVSITLEEPRETCPQIQNPTATGDHVTVNPVGVSGSATVEVNGTFLHRNNAGGVGKFVFCKNTGPLTSFHVVPDCNKQKTNAPCMVKVNGSGAGDVTFTMRLKFDTVAQSWDPNFDGGH